MSAERVPEPGLHLVDNPPDGPDGGALHEVFQKHRRARGLKRVWRVGAGIALLVVGIIDIPLPGPGTLLIAAGLAMLAPDFPPARRLVLWTYRRWPGLRRRVPRGLRRLGRPSAEDGDEAGSGSA